MKTYIFLFITMLTAFTATAQNAITGYEYWFNQDDASPVFVDVNPATYFSANNITIDASELPPGYHRLYIRLKDSRGYWSSVLWRNVTVPKTEALNTITALRYWSDVSQPYPSDMREITFDPPTANLDEQLLLDFCDVEPGQQTVYFQLKDNRGYYGPVIQRTVNVTETGPPADFTISEQGNILTSGAASSNGIQWYLNGEAIPGANAGTYTHTFTEEGEYTYHAVISNDCGTAESDTQTIRVTDVHEIGVPGTLRLYPNPVSRQLFIEQAQGGLKTVRLYNLLGELVMQPAVTQGNSLAVDVQHLPAGVYVLHVELANGRLLTERVVKQ